MSCPSMSFFGYGWQDSGGQLLPAGMEEKENAEAKQQAGLRERRRQWSVGGLSWRLRAPSATVVSGALVMASGHRGTAGS